jgi:hypothetical protein
VLKGFWSNKNRFAKQDKGKIGNIDFMCVTAAISGVHTCQEEREKSAHQE